MDSDVSSLLLDLLRGAVPDVPLDRGVAQANTNVAALDALPLLTMLPCLQTLHLYWVRRRHTDFLLFACGFVLAGIYHWLHMHPEGIANAHFMGLPGPAWRGLDILMAQALLARTLGHAVGARSSAIHFISNLVFPSALLVYAHILNEGVLTLGVASKVLVGVLLATLAAKAALEGFHTLPKYCPRRGKRTIVCFAIGFACFPMPELFPTMYWLFHSLWHIFLADAYHLLYLQLEGIHLEDGEEEGEEEEEEEEEDGGSEADSASKSQGMPSSEAHRAGWAQALLPPAERLWRYQRLPARKKEV